MRASYSSRPGDRCKSRTPDTLENLATTGTPPHRLIPLTPAEKARRLAALRAARARALARRHLGVRVVRAARAPSGAARVAVDWALAQVGKPYQWGAAGPDSFDCSGLTMTAYATAGVSLPRTSREQWDSGPHLDLADLAPGDLVFFADNTSDPETIHHVAMYIGRGLMVEAPFTGADVRVSSIDRPDYIGAVRPTG